MRRSAMTLTGNNFYRRENEAIGVESACNLNGLGVFDDMKKSPDGTSILSLPGWKLLSGWADTGYYQLVTEDNGFVFRRPIAAISQTIVVQPNIIFPGDFNFQFDTALQSHAGTTQVQKFAFYVDQYNSATYWWKYRWLYSTVSFKYGQEYIGGGSGLGSDATGVTKLKFARTGTNLYTYHYTTSWSGAIYTRAIGTAPLVMTFEFTFPDASNYIESELKNFVLNSGQTQILW